MSDTDLQLLARYTRHQSEDAFAELVRRHLDLVHSAALRQVRSPQLAEEVAQSAFTDLARHASRLAPDTILTAWLYQVTRRTAIDVVRCEARRQLREQIATEMNALNASSGTVVSPVWIDIEPHLDEAMSALDDTDRAAVLLRYFDNKSLREVGATLGLSDDAAQKRVSRAVERLRAFFAKRGVTIGASGLVVVLSANAVQAAPVGLAVTISTAVALAALSIPASAGAGAAAGFFGTLFQVSRTKLVVGLAAVLVGVTIFILVRSQERAGQFANSGGSPLNAEQNKQSVASANQDANVGDEQGKPDPFKLLQAVARARERIVSGSLELQLSSEHFELARARTNGIRLLALFDEPKLRYERFGQQYSYAYSVDEAEQDEIRKRADSMDRESAIRAGLSKPFESHRVTAYDGAVLLKYWETDGNPTVMNIDDPGEGSSGEIIFDPRCLGLRTTLSVGNTIENCLGYIEAKSITLVSKESVDGIPAWHVHVLSKHDESLDFWIDVAQPTRLLKQANGSDFVLSKYEDANLRDPIPIEVTTKNFRNGSPLFYQRFLRTKSNFNIPIEPSLFTLAGLGMKVGTDVCDSRISRSIGYWTGTGLSENLPPKKGVEPETPPNLAELLALLESDPASTEALEAAIWILLNTPDGPEVEKAAEVILREHTRDPNLVDLCKQLERVRHRCARPLLEGMLKDNSSADVRGTACFALATMFKAEAKYGQNKKATTEADKHFERVIAEFSQAGRAGAELARRAKPELDELRRLIIGKPAPDTEGEDLNGQPMKLGDYRSKVTVLVFWSGDFSEAHDYRKLIAGMAGKPFVFLGVNCDKDLARAKASVEKYGITWPSFRDGRDGPISTLWNSHSWPDLWVLDHQGVIRYRNVRGRDLSDAVDTLLRE